MMASVLIDCWGWYWEDKGGQCQCSTTPAKSCMFPCSWWLTMFENIGQSEYQQSILNIRKKVVETYLGCYMDYVGGGGMRQQVGGGNGEQKG